MFGSSICYEITKVIGADFFDLLRMILLFAQFVYLCCLCACAVRELYKCLICNNNKKKRKDKEGKKEKEEQVIWSE